MKKGMAVPPIVFLFHAELAMAQRERRVVGGNRHHVFVSSLFSFVCKSSQFPFPGLVNVMFPSCEIICQKESQYSECKPNRFPAFKNSENGKYSE